MRVLVVGATGVLGRHTIPRLIERGHTVRALIRRPEQAPPLAFWGAETALGDILDPATLAPALAGCDAALHLATAVPRPGQPAEWSRNDAIRREGTRHLLAAAERAGVRRYLQQSITFIYGSQGATIVSESTPLNAPARLASAVEMEEAVQASPLEWCILRGGALYGPGTGREDDWRQQARASRLALPGDGSALISLIHAADFARAIVLAAESAPRGSVYNVVDDMPVTYRELYGYIATQIGAPHPATGGHTVDSLGCDNSRLKAALDWLPCYPSYRSGLA